MGDKASQPLRPSTGSPDNRSAVIALALEWPERPREAATGEGVPASASGTSARVARAAAAEAERGDGGKVMPS